MFKQYRDFWGIHICGIVYHICGNFDPQMWYAQNSEIIETIRIQKNFLKIPIGKLFSKIDPISSLIDTTIVV